MTRARAAAKRPKKAATTTGPPPEPVARRAPPTGPAADLFWEIIGRVGARTHELGPACEAFEEELNGLDDPLLGVASVFFRAMSCAEDWDLYCAAVVIHGGATDDMFWDFRAGLVALGRQIFEAALEDPGSLADVADVAERTLFEGFQYVPEQVLRARGLEVPVVPRSPMSGVRPADYPECVARLPRLAIRAPRGE